MKNKIIIVVLVILSIIIFLYFQNNIIDVERFEYISKSINKKFDGFKILHISDLHNKMFFNKQEYIVKKIKKQNPDIIVITGDIIDRRSIDLTPTKIFIEKVKDIAPVLYVEGNHEVDHKMYDDLMKIFSDNGVNVLNDMKYLYKKEDSSLEFVGVRDPLSFSGFGDIIKKYKNEDFNILLTHRTEEFEMYKENKYNIIFSGHAHGGQFRLFNQGIFSPGQGLFPKYTSGEYKENESSMYVSRGLGNSRFPFRLFNHPHIIVVELKKE